MTICDLMRILREHYEPMAAGNGMSFSIAPDPQAPYTAILNGGAAGMCILVYAGQARLDDTPRGRVPVGSRFEIFVSAPTQLSADKAGGGALFRPSGNAASRRPLYEICEDFETDITAFEIPDNDGTVERCPFYEGTDPAVMPGGHVLNAYRIAFRIRRAMTTAQA
jgi:hypothetical protein